MRIDEFLSLHEDEVCAACVRVLAHSRGDASEEELQRHFRVFTRQLIKRLRRAAGLPEEAALPEPRETAATVGE